MNNIKRHNPSTMPAPVGNYSHVTKIPRNSELYVMSGQIGINEAGKIAEEFNTQVKDTFVNLKKALSSEGLEPADIIKVNIWSVVEIDWEYFYEEWVKFFPREEYPAMTIGYIAALGLPEIKIEIEIWCAKV